jgi:hypothetical protein
MEVPLCRIVVIPLTLTDPAKTSRVGGNFRAASATAIPASGSFQRA